MLFNSRFGTRYVGIRDHVFRESGFEIRYVVIRDSGSCTSGFGIRYVGIRDHVIRESGLGIVYVRIRDLGLLRDSIDLLRHYREITSK
jgi:hypothetical protein